ncbi:peroxisomal membrane protein [Rhizoctonia solani AG-1 IA]|uniref:Peroxisomal membrane protein n=1 Tax=Thanatephorus cucumeris (strain AG1-IA) TaxID=983506 RepID=L8WXE3_THACA|nr:peroxisomal membrane protein [Rhizoctonia solani AG-1 IA]
MSHNDQLTHAMAGGKNSSRVGHGSVRLRNNCLFSGGRSCRNDHDIPTYFPLNSSSCGDQKGRQGTWPTPTIMDIIQTEGLRGLYSGLNSSLLGIAVTNGKGNALSTLESMLAGLVAGSATSIASNPLWVIQTTQAVRTLPSTTAPSKAPEPQGPRKKLGFFATIRWILRTDGPAAFWRGIGPALVLVINPILQYTVFEQLKNALVAQRTLKLRTAKLKGIPTLSSLDYFLLGALSKLVATTITYPYIVIKSRMQSGHAHTREYKSAWDGLSKIMQREGVAGLYRGIGSKLAQSVLTAAILFAGQKRFYELIKTVSNSTAQNRFPLSNKPSRYCLRESSSQEIK